MLIDLNIDCRPIL